MSDPFSEAVVQPLSRGNNSNNKKDNKKKRSKNAAIGNDGFASNVEPVRTTTAIPNINNDDDGNNAVQILNEDGEVDDGSLQLRDTIENDSFQQKNNNNNTKEKQEEAPQQAASVIEPVPQSQPVTTISPSTTTTTTTNNNNDDDDDNAVISPDEPSSQQNGSNNNNDANNNKSNNNNNNIPIIARSVGAPIIVSWVTAHSTKKGTAMITGNYTIRTGIKLGDASAQETVFEVKRSLLDLLQFRLGYLQTKPYTFIGDLPPEDTMRHDADEVLAFVHIIVNNPSLCDSVLTWHLLTIPQDELKGIGLPSSFSVFKNVIFGSGSFFGPTTIPTAEQLKIEVIAPQIVADENLRNEVFRVLDLVGEACEMARGFSYSRIKFNQRAVHWERLRVACIEMVQTHSQLNEASSEFENAMRDIACDGALFWPWTMTQTLADEKLRLENQTKKEERRKLDSKLNSSTNLNNNRNTTSAQNNDDDDQHHGVDPLLPAASPDSEKYRKTPHPTIQLGKSFLNAANLTENICKQTVALDLQNLTTVVTLMTKVDFACAQSSVQADEYFRNSSEELKLIHTLLKTIKELASAGTFNENALRKQLEEIGEAAKVISKRVTEMQEDLRQQIQSVRSATHFHVVNEVERWVMGQRFTWCGAEMLANEVKKRIHAELDGNSTLVQSSGVPAATDSQKNMAITKNQPQFMNQQKQTLTDQQFFSESLPMFQIEAGKQKKEVTFGPPVLEDLSLAFNLGDGSNNTKKASSDNKPKSGGSIFGKSIFGNDNNSSSAGAAEKKRAARHAIAQPNEGGNMMSTMSVEPSPSRINPQPRRERAARSTAAVKTAVLDDPFARL